MPTLEEIAQLTGVSRSTVSRVINNDPHVNAKTRDRVLETIQRTNYHPNHAARSLAGGTNRILGLVIPTGVANVFGDPYFPTLIRGISATCQERDYSVMLWLAEPAYERRTVFQVLQNGIIDGVIVSSMPVDEAIIDALVGSKIPFVLVGRHPSHPKVSYVDVKNQEGAALATHHLIDRGRKRIACISGPLNTIVGIDRQAGYLQALHEAGLPVETELMVESNFSEEDAYEKTKALLPYQPDAIFAASDAMALGALRALHAAGFRVPEEVAVVGFDDLPFSAHTTPTLTTIRQPILLTGKMAANTLIDLLEYPTAVSLNTILPVELVIRESSGK